MCCLPWRVLATGWAVVILPLFALWGDDCTLEEDCTLGDGPAV